MLESGCPDSAISQACGLQQVFISFVLVFICKIGIKLPLTSHRLVEGLNGIIDAKAHCKRLLNPYTNVARTGSSGKPSWILDLHSGPRTAFLGWSEDSTVGSRIN